MIVARIRLVAALILFAGWLGYLAYLVHAQPHIFVSEPQILVSRLDVVAEVKNDGKDARVKVLRVLYPPSAKEKLEGEEITVVNLSECRGPRRPPPTKRDAEPPLPPPDFSGPGEYLLPLRPLGTDTKYEVVPIPASPGYPRSGPPHFYRADRQTLAQYEKLLPEKGSDGS